MEHSTSVGAKRAAQSATYLVLEFGKHTRNSRPRQGAPKAKFDAIYTSTEFDYLGFGLLLTTGS